MNRGLGSIVDQLTGDFSPDARRAAILQAVDTSRAQDAASLDLQQLALCDGDFNGDVLEAILSVAPHLRVLNLFLNELTYLPQWVGQCSNLQELHCGCNPLERVDDTVFTNLAHLRELDLGYGQKLQQLPASVAALTSLKVCWLGNNRIDTIPSGLYTLPALEELHLYGNDLSNVPPGISQCTNLRNLNLGRNQITSVPPELGKLVQLEILQLYDNSLDSLPRELLDIPNLKTLGLHGNPAMNMPPSDVLRAGVKGSIQFYSDS